jgi:HAD superfamily hydrolase (TIGR01509 family)
LARRPQTAPIHALLFDLDNTLIDRDEALKRALAKRLPPADVAEVMRRDQGGYGDRRELVDWLAAQHPHLLARAARPLTAGAIAQLIVPVIEPDPLVCELLAHLNRRYRLAVVTNGGALQRDKLERAELTRFFSAIVVSSELGVAKPAKAIFHHAMAELRCEPQTSLFIGDNPERDIVGAKGCGLPACWLSRGRSYPSRLIPPDFTIERIDGLKEVLAC